MPFNNSPIKKELKEIAYSEGQLPENIGVANPFALADLIAEEDIAWNKVENRKSVLWEILESPYEELFDPVHQSPLYWGLTLLDDMSVKKAESQPLEIEMPEDMSDDQIFGLLGYFYNPSLLDGINCYRLIENPVIHKDQVGRKRIRWTAP